MADTVDKMEARVIERAPWPLSYLAFFACVVTLQATIERWGHPVVDWMSARHGSFDEPTPVRAAPDAVPIGSAVSVLIGPDNRRYVLPPASDMLTVSGPDGTELWRFSVPREEIAAPKLGPDGTVYVRSSKTLHALARDGSVKWTFDLADVFRSPAHFAAFGSGTDVTLAVGGDGTVYLGLWNVWALTPNGSIKWASDGIQLCHALLLGDGGVLYSFATPDLVAMRTSDGSALWKLEERQSLRVGGRTTDGTILLTGHNLTAVDATGRVRWRKRFENDVEGVAIGNDRLYVTAGALYALTMQGQQLWRFRPKRLLFSDPALMRDSVVAAGREVFSLSLDGRLQWRLPVPARALTAEPEGTLMVIGEDRMMYRLTDRR